ncbi:MAG: hypothetical protein ACFCBV_01705 [Phycisphaerales bacterium]
MLLTIAPHVLRFSLALIQASDPVPPERVDPAAMPTTPAVEPVMPADGRIDQTRPIGQRAQEGREPIPASFAPPVRTREAPSIFTDEAYRHARVRSLLLRAYDRQR